MTIYHYVKDIHISLPMSHIICVTSGFKLCAFVRLILPFHSDWTTPPKLCKPLSLSLIASFTSSLSSYPSFFIILSSTPYPEFSIMEAPRTEKAKIDPSTAVMNSHPPYISKSFINHSVPNFDLTI